MRTKRPASPGSNGNTSATWRSRGIVLAAAITLTKVSESLDKLTLNVFECRSVSLLL